MPPTQIRHHPVPPPHKDDLCVVISVDPSDRLAELASFSDTAEHEKRWSDLIKQLKKPLLSALKPYERFGLRVVDDLHDTPQLIAAGPVPAWQLFLTENKDFRRFIGKTDLHEIADWQVY